MGKETFSRQGFCAVSYFLTVKWKNHEYKSKLYSYTELWVTIENFLGHPSFTRQHVPRNMTPEF